MVVFLQCKPFFLYFFVCSLILKSNNLLSCPENRLAYVMKMPVFCFIKLIKYPNHPLQSLQSKRIYSVNLHKSWFVSNAGIFIGIPATVQAHSAPIDPIAPRAPTATTATTAPSSLSSPRVWQSIRKYLWTPACDSQLENTHGHPRATVNSKILRDTRVRQSIRKYFETLVCDSQFENTP